MLPPPPLPPPPIWPGGGEPLVACVNRLPASSIVSHEQMARFTVDAASAPKHTPPSLLPRRMGAPTPLHATGASPMSSGAKSSVRCVQPTTPATATASSAVAARLMPRASLRGRAQRGQPIARFPCELPVGIAIEVAAQRRLRLGALAALAPQ